jgi:serine/threonine-protein kinase
MGPLGVWLAYLRGAATPSVADTLLMYLPNYTCGAAAILPSLIFQRLGRKLREAREVGNYQLIKRLGRGGMGEVWLARHRLLARPAAVKLISPETLGANSGSEAARTLRRFEQEAQATSALSSEHTIRLFDFGSTEEGSFYYVMELLDGRNLESLVHEFGPCPADRALYLLRQVCRSLAEAHVKGLVHRDVKPANIFVCRIGLDYDFVKVLDFGLVQILERDVAEAVTQLTGATNRVEGTPGYMAPEIILQRSVDGRADVYAVGCVAYFILTGQEVFQSGTRKRMETLIDHVHAAPVRPSERSALPIPPSVDALVLSCLQKDPNDRPQDATEVLKRIDDCHVTGTWSSERAHAWWLKHRPNLAGTLTLGFDEMNSM